jgi:Domain of unknown function (DUF4157)/L,D-transpeptidase catalytic domain
MARRAFASRRVLQRSKAKPEVATQAGTHADRPATSDFESAWSEPDFDQDWSEPNFDLDWSQSNAPPWSLGSDAPPSRGSFDQALTNAQMGGGEALSPRLEAWVDGTFGRDFEDVRVHRDARAHELSEAVDARAFTIGRDLFFNRGEFQPETQSGQHLIAHELSHVAQQGAGVAPVQVQRAPKAATKTTPKAPAKPAAAKAPKPKLNACGFVSRKNPDYPKTFIEQVNVTLSPTKSTLSLSWKPATPTIPGLDLKTTYNASPGLGICRLAKCVKQVKAEKHDLDARKKRLDTKKAALGKRRKALMSQTKRDHAWQAQMEVLEKEEETWRADKAKFDEDLKNFKDEKRCCADCNDFDTSRTEGSLCTPFGTHKVYQFGCQFDEAWTKNPTYFQQGRAGIAIHASPNDAALGPPASHGCLRTESAAAAIIHDNSVKQKTEIAVSGTWSSGRCFPSEKSGKSQRRADVCLPKPKAGKKGAGLAPLPMEPGEMLAMEAGQPSEEMSEGVSGAPDAAVASEEETELTTGTTTTEEPATSDEELAAAMQLAEAEAPSEEALGGLDEELAMASEAELEAEESQTQEDGS